MANEFTVSTDKEEKVQLDSGIIEASWISPIAYGGFDAKFVVKTYFVAEGSTIEIKGKSSKGKAPGKVKGQVFNNEFKGVLLIPEKVDPEAEIWFEAKLPKHGLTMESSEIPARPPIAIKELYWDRDEVTRNDTVTLTCLFESGVRDGEEAVFIIYEHNPDSCDMKVVSIPAFIEGNKAEILWEFDYIYDTKAIPTEEEKNNVQKKYVHPQYYFMVGVNGIRAGENRESGLMKFYDFLELNVADASGNAVADKTFTVSCADGSCIDGKLDDKGYAKVEKIPPGPYNVEVKDVEIGPSESAGDGGGTTADGTKDTKKNDTSTEEKNSKKDEEKKTDDVLTFPGTTFKHKKTVKTVDECLSTLPAEFRKDFKSEVENVIKEMHKLGIAMGVLSSAKAGYRSFKVQNDIDPTKTKAGPGE